MSEQAPELVEQPYLVPSHLRTQQTWGPMPARFILPTLYATMFPGAPLAAATWSNTGLVLPTAAAALAPAVAMLPLSAWWLDPPAEHGAVNLVKFVSRTYHAATPSPDAPIAVYRMPTVNLETASVAARRRARSVWGSLLNELTHPIKIIIRGRPLTSLANQDALLGHERAEARELGRWLEGHLSTAELVDRDRLLVVPATTRAELAARTRELEKKLRSARIDFLRIPEEHLPLLRTLTWNPRATEPSETPEIAEGWSEVMCEGWWHRAYALSAFPPSILTNWASPLLAGTEPLDVAFDIVPQDVEYVKTWVLDVKIKQLETSIWSASREVALENLRALRMAFERRRVMPFEVAGTVLVRGASQADVRARSRSVVSLVHGTGARLKLLRWEQAAGLLQLDPVRTTPLPRRAMLTETGTVARTYPWSDNILQLANGVPWGEAGSQPCIFTPFVKGNKGSHMAWYGTTNAGKGVGCHTLWSRLHLIRGVRIFGIDQDEQHEHCGRFLEYLGGRKLEPRDARDAAEIELHADDGAVILDLSDVDEDMVGGVFAAWSVVVKRHMLAYPGASIFFVDEAVTVAEDPIGERALRDAANRSRHWGQSLNVITQRPSTWFGTKVGRAIQGNSDAWWCGAQQPRELDEVARALRLTDEEEEFVDGAPIGHGLLVSGGRRVTHDLFEKLSPGEYAAFNTDPVVTPVVVDLEQKRRELAS